MINWSEMMNRYKIGFDVRIRSLLAELPEIEAKSPKEAAEKYAGCSVARHYPQRGGDILVKALVWPYKTYLYDRQEIAND